jgi:hypothetical protein
MLTTIHCKRSSLSHMPRGQARGEDAMMHNEANP